jgi:uncharacterized protein YjdB
MTYGNGNNATICRQHIPSKVQEVGSGLLTAVKNGQVKVIATANDGSGVSGASTITISAQTLVFVKKIKITGGKAIKVKNGTLQLVVVVSPTNADNTSVTWTILYEDDTPTDKAVISSSGVVTALKNGVMKVVAQANDGSALLHAP